ncbi:MAG: insulinase family protein [Fimbriimonadaceae bacterium]|nr:insulinase family protein [Fimbriimonadaceae bacterium]
MFESGASCLVERMPDAREVAISLWASSRSARETPTTHGFRHLLEHLVAKGRDGTLDARLESEGITLTASTYRDATHIQLSCPVGKEATGLAALAEILRPFATTPEAIRREVAVMRHEFASVADADRLAAAGWVASFGGKGLDPFGTLAALEGATPDSLRDLHARQFAKPNLCVVVVGPVDLDRTTARIAELVATAPDGGPSAGDPLPAPVAGRVEIEQAVGEARTGFVNGFLRPGTLATLGAALAVASEMGDCFVAYTPSLGPGVVTLGREEQVGGLGARLDALTEADKATLYRSGYDLLRRWIDRYLTSPSGVAYLRGFLQVQELGARPEDAVGLAKKMTFDEFKEGLAAFGRDRATIVVGVRR